MNLKELKEIIDLVTSQDSIEEFEIEKSGVHVRIRKSANHQPPSGIAAPTAVSASAGSGMPVPPQTVRIPAEAEDLAYIKSPIVGTFYRAPSPTSET